jgi:hypothetical protein
MLTHFTWTTTHKDYINAAMADRDVTPDDSLLKQIFTTN